MPLIFAKQSVFSCTDGVSVRFCLYLAYIDSVICIIYILMEVSMSIISVNNLTFCYEGSADNVFENVNFSIDTDWKLGFISRNGRGKTTFLQLLMGKYEYSGRITSSVKFDYFPFEISDENENAETVILRAAGMEEEEFWRLGREMKLLNLDEEILTRPFCTLSNGEKTKLMLAALFVKENNFLLIDEPTNHLDAEGRRSVARYLNGKSGFILVSHDRKFLDECIDHVLSINRSTIEVIQGSYTSWQREKTRRDNFEISENKRLTAEINSLKQAASRIASWSDKIEATKIGMGPCDRGAIGAKSAKMMRHAKAQQSRLAREIEKREDLLHDVEYDEQLKIFPEPYYKDNMVFIKDLSLFYGEKCVADGINLTVKQGDRLALTGKNGCGKSSLIKLLTGEKIEHTGFIEVGSRLSVSVVPQDMSFLTGDLDEFAAESGVDLTLFKTILRKLDFKRTQFEKDMSDFSMGQKKKVLLARSLCQRANLYVWDEPLNYIDVISRLQIEALILRFCPTMVFVEHDRAFVDDIATKVFDFSDKETVKNSAKQ